MASRRLILPGQLVYGWGAMDNLKAQKANRALIVTDQTMTKLGFVERVRELLGDASIEAQIFDGVEPEPGRESIEPGASRAQDYGPDLIIGLGGGSCLDAAKAIWVFYEHPHLSGLPWSEVTPQVPRLKLREKARFVAIPSTSGTGSETTPVAAITDREGDLPLKLRLLSLRLLPDVAIVDAQLPTTMPPHITADTGFDALVHALESFVFNPPSEFPDAFSVRAIQTIFRWLPRAVHHGDDREARERLHMASTMAGIAMCNSGTGLVHDTSHQLGGAFGIAHGRSNALMLNSVLGFILPEAEARIGEAAQALGIPAEDGKKALEGLIAALDSLKREIGIPLSIREAGVDRDRYMSLLDRFSANAISTAFRPGRASQEEIRGVFLRAWEGGAPL
ncbi:MAG: iron-containing alcohol dehydrogenase [Dehalococcoidia bacterium]